jgi:hypothetical protein
VGRHADWGVVLRFALPAALAAVVGARLLFVFADLPALATYQLAGAERRIAVLPLIVGLLIVLFACLELSEPFERAAIPRRFLIIGAVISGFFGGLTGNQGAFRSAFLIRTGLDKEAFVGTGVIATVIVDTVRLTVYGLAFYASQVTALSREVLGPVAAAMAAAFLGAYLGARLLRKVTLRFVQLVVALAMIVFGLALAAGVV